MKKRVVSLICLLALLLTLFVPGTTAWAAYEDMYLLGVNDTVMLGFINASLMPVRREGSIYAPCTLLENPDLAKRICEEVEGIETLDFRGENWHRFAAAGADKVSALREMAKLLGIELGQIAAFGDDRNDIGMLKAVGMGVAMGNAIEEVKAVAKYTALSNDEDGAARFIEENLFKEG